MLCPKCHQPIEGDEPYICCASAPLTWHCTVCKKVSEGFAFPYGACPLCGGELELLGDRDIEDPDDFDSIRMAFEIELGGRAFYSRASREASEPVLQELFGKLAEMENEHMETLARRYHAHIPECAGEFEIERAAIFGGIERWPDDPANLFRIAIACEARAVAFFSERAAQVPEGSVEHELYEELAAEEREHVALLTTEYERWKEGKPGLL